MPEFCHGAASSLRAGAHDPLPTWLRESAARCGSLPRPLGEAVGLLAERADVGVATLKTWRLLRNLRCSTTRITALVRAVLTLHLNASS